MKKSIIVFLVFYFLITPFSAFALSDKKFGVKVFIPVSELASSNDFDNSVNTIEEKKPTTSGHSLHFSLANRIGIGYTNLKTSFKLSGVASYSLNLATHSYNLDVDYMLESNFLDLFYTFGDKIDITLGFGFMVSGVNENKIVITPTSSSKYYEDDRITIANNYSGTYISKDNSGTSIFINFAIPISNFELIVGYRHNRVSYSNFAKQGGGGLDMSNVALKGTSKQIMAGIGYIF